MSNEERETVTITADDVGHIDPLDLAESNGPLPVDPDDQQPGPPEPEAQPEPGLSELQQARIMRDVGKLMEKLTPHLLGTELYVVAGAIVTIIDNVPQLIPLVHGALAERIARYTVEMAFSRVTGGGQPQLELVRVPDPEPSGVPA